MIFHRLLKLTRAVEGNSGVGRVETSISSMHLRNGAIKKLIFTALKLVLELNGKTLSLKSR